MNNSIKILISGDFCPIGRNEILVRERNYEALFGGFELRTKEADLSIVNLECPVTNTNNIPIKKTGPNIRTQELNTFEALKYANFSLLTLANNHILDYGEQGVIDTVNGARKAGLDIVGAGINVSEAARPFIQKIKGKSIAIINIAENEFCAATASAAGAYTIDIINNIKLIRRTRLLTDIVLLIYHGGREHYQLPTPKQKELFHFFIENGVDAIVAHHTHCYSGYEYYNDKPIVYGLGNFIFDYKPKYQTGKWTEGCSVELVFSTTHATSIELIPHFQGRTENPRLTLLTDSEKILFQKKVRELNSKITDEKAFQQEWQEYIATQSKIYLANILFKNKYFRALAAKGLIPLRMTKNFSLLVLNLIRCETHHEILKDVLRKQIVKNERGVL